MRFYVILGQDQSRYSLKIQNSSPIALYLLLDSIHAAEQSSSMSFFYASLGS